IYSLLFLAVRPDRMNEDQRRTLRFFRDPLAKFLAGLAPLPLIWAVWKLYALAPLATDLSPLPNHGIGLVVAAIAFLLANLFVQVPLGVLRVLLVPERAFSKVPPYPPEQVKQDFTLLGLRVNRILPDWSASEQQVKVKPSAEASSSVSVADASLSTPPLEEVWDDESIPLDAPATDIYEYAAPVEESSPVEIKDSVLDVSLPETLDTAPLPSGEPTESEPITQDFSTEPITQDFSTSETALSAVIDSPLLVEPPEAESIEQDASTSIAALDLDQAAELLQADISAEDVAAVAEEASPQVVPPGTDAEEVSSQVAQPEPELAVESSQEDLLNVEEDLPFSSRLQDSNDSEPFLQP
ncbi:MAG TPA: low-complexity tail membrane protein, partial [Trichocoleus sp.]